MNKTWVLVANRVRARLLEVSTDGREINEIGDFFNPDGRAPSGTRGDRRPPRTIESVGGARHAIEPHTEPAVKIAERFAHHLDSILEDGRVNHQFDHLVLAATPRFLGQLRGGMNQHLRACVEREYHHDLTRSSAEAIRRTCVERPHSAR